MRSAARDNCGILAIADLRQDPSHELLTTILGGIGRMEHRGGSLAGTGDGSGVLLRPERCFYEQFVAPGRSLSSPDEPLIVGTVTFLPGERNIQEHQREVNAILRRSGLRPLGWRRVPVNPDVLGTRARQDAPLIYQVLVAKGHRRQSDLFRVLYQVKGQIEDRFAGGLAVPSLSPYTTIYKALATADQLARYYPDLSDPSMSTRVALGHRRFSTNTFSNWHLVQPFRLIAHNGEINTITANCRAVQDVDSAIQVGCRLMLHGSDSAQLDRVVEMVSANGMSNIAEALRRLMPPAWGEGRCLERERRFYEGNRRAMGTLGAWEGPAAITATDGQLLVGMLDRMGLRPLRYLQTTSGRVIVSSEMGAVPVQPEEIELDGQLEPGEMLVADLLEGVLIPPNETSAWVISRSGLNFDGLSTEKVASVQLLRGSPPQEEVPVRALNAFGWTRERIRRLKETVKRSSAPVQSMGNDLPLAIFSENHSRLYSFVNQIVAVVTNPPIDPLREGGAIDTTVYLGRSPRVTRFSDYLSWPQYQLEHPVLTDEQVAGLLASESPDLRARRLDATMTPTEDAWDLVRRIHDLTDEALELVRGGVSILVLSDRETTTSDRLPLPMLLLVGAVHRALTSAGLRRDSSVVMETGEVHEGHDLAVLLAYGATAVNPYAMFQIARTVAGLDPEQATRNLTQALVQTLRRIMSKMGITSLAGYRGSALFEAIGLSSEVVEYFIPDTISRLGGLELDDIYRDMTARAAGGDERVGRNRNVGVYRKAVTNTLQLVARNGNSEGDYDRFVALLQETPPIYLRDLLDLQWAEVPVEIDEVAGVKTIVRDTLRGAAMSHGALHSTAHRAIAAGFNHFGALSNAGEGGEDERRNPGGDWEDDRNRIRQVASGRFGVDAAYLVGADEIEIKIGQGAKPGEGGHLPAAKVTEEIARIRKVRPGVALISPPPHHDIYSIEDLAQLVLHLRQVNPKAAISIKVPSISNLGTIAMGIVKAGADLITISGFEGGTGAAYAGSILHAGLPLDRGISEVHQYLLVNGVRHHVRLRADGGLKCGADVAKIIALGADEVTFGTPLLVAENCVYCRGCSHGQCPVGIATHDHERQAQFMRRHLEEVISEGSSMEERYQEARAGVIRYLECVAEDLRRILSRLGLRHPRELVGRVDLLSQRRTGNLRWDRLDLGELLHDPRDSQAETSPVDQPPLDRGVLPCNQRIMEAVAHVLRGESELQRSAVALEVDSSCHALGATLAGELARAARSGRQITVELQTQGTSGQGLGFAATRGMSLRHVGYANDTVGEIMSHDAQIVIVSPGPPEPHLVGNAAAYGATGGTLLVAGRAGQRFGVRNSGATLVCEGVGKYAFEYMTGGVGVVLGPCGPCVAPGMTGGELFLLDPSHGDGRDLPALLHPDVVGHNEIGSRAAELLLAILKLHLEQAKSAKAAQILELWPESLSHFLHVIPRESLELLDDLAQP